MDTLSCDDMIIDTTIIDGCGPSNGCGPSDGCGQDEDRITYERHRQELQRLQAMYCIAPPLLINYLCNYYYYSLPICEFQLINNQVKMAYVSEAIRKAEEEILLMERQRKDTREIGYDVISI